MDFQHRGGGKAGTGFVSDAQTAMDRKERLRKLAMETIDLQKDPYFMRNHLGQFECRLCLTIHPTEGNYLAHTQGKRHQQNLARRAAKEAKDAQAPQPKKVVPRKTIKIGRPAYQVIRLKDPETNQMSLKFVIDYPQAEDGCQPRHRIMSAFEQKVETPPDRNFQYLLFACEPYETIAFKIPNKAIDKSEDKFFYEWDKEDNRFTLQIYFTDRARIPRKAAQQARPGIEYHDRVM
eukprot:TRINITY_DN778080_c0_g1_i1.p1 TRINITY_DN778080_c0_g1~~TRINITY_DN778080_c0_g1_i1.p1  ORF type:complete len:235 (-),score=75.85 TRINITY_DN778080_c0_g1_i1:122-826(-)